MTPKLQNRPRHHGLVAFSCGTSPQRALPLPEGEGRGEGERAMRRPGFVSAIVVCVALIAGCSFAPKYTRPPLQTPAAFKELTATNFAQTDGWKTAEPKDDALRGKWWEPFGDSQLNALEEQASSSNQTVVAALANFFAARAVVKQSRAQLFPTVSANPSVTRSHQAFANNTAVVPTRQSTTTAYTLPLDASWEPDLWGNIRNTVKANTLEAQATFADLENVRLTVRAEVAADYFQLRALDAQKQLFDSTVVA